MNETYNDGLMSIRTIWQLIVLSRPEWGFIFSQVALMVALLYQLPLESLLTSSFSIFLFSLGHFSLNGYYDRQSDALNPRGLSLRNPLTNSIQIPKNHVLSWIILIWVLLIPFNLIMVLNSLSQQKLLLGLFSFSMGMLGSILYSVPPFKLKAKPFLDILVTFFIIGIFIPVYIGLLGPSTLVDLDLLFLGILFCLVLISGIHLPTMLIDIETDQDIGDNTTAVFLGRRRATYLTAGVVLTRVVLLISLNLTLMNNGVLIPHITPFILGLLEIIAVLNLLKRKDHEGASLLFKTIVITSGGGAVLFGLLYSPTLLSAYSL